MEESFRKMTSTTQNRVILLKNKALKTLLPLIIILAVWEVAAWIINNSFILPTVWETALALFGIVTDLSFFAVLFTAFFRVLFGLAFGTLIGIILATLCHYFPIADTLISPVISIMKSTPVACIIVLLWLSMNYTEIAIFVVLLMVMPIVWQNVLDGYHAIDKELYEVTRVFNFSFLKRVKVLVAPSLFNYLKPALITSIGLAWKAEIAAEIMTNSNIGALIYRFRTVSYDTAAIFAWTVIIITFSIILEKTAKSLIRRLNK